MTRAIPAVCITFVKGAEACRLTAYQDSKGVWTIGYGHTGPEVVKGLVWTQAQADEALVADLAIAAGRLASVVNEPAIAGLTDHEYGALVSFVFNLGEEPDWTIWKLLNKGRYDLVPDQMKRFDKARINGQIVVVPGLDHRRLAEVTLWNDPDAAAAIAVLLAAPVAPPPSSETRAADTPPTPPIVKPLVQSRSFVASGVTAVVATASAAAPVIQAASGGVKQVSDAISPYSDAAPMIAHVVQYLAMGSAALAVVTLGLLWLKNSQAKAA